MQEKADKIKPKTEKKITINSTDINKSSIKENNSTTVTYQENNNLEELALAVQADVDYKNLVYTDAVTESIVEEPTTITSVSSSIGNNWIEMSKEEEIILTAEAFLGAKYVWAANGPECFDCSGFTKYVYRENGMTIPRYSGHQAQVGMQVSYDELQVGDLVFFDTTKSYKGKVNHVGIYVGGDRFIHASSAKKHVVITSFEEKRFYRDRFLWGQRVVNDSTYASL
jgi:cell wall-associated NlpC family hydrolase